MKKIDDTNTSKIVIAGATGNLGGLISKYLLEIGAEVHALVRKESSADKVSDLKEMGVKVHRIDFAQQDQFTEACSGAKCIVSALSGLQSTIFDAQSQLLDAAISADIPRFIPSDYSIDFTKIPDGSNRNLEVRKKFQLHIDKMPIAATSILNGAFTDMLTGQAPIVLFKFKRVLYWGNADQKMDFTSIDDTARFTAKVAMDDHTPRYLRIAGDQISARELCSELSALTGEKYKLFYAGGLSVLGAIIKITRRISPESDELYPPWQGMQYLHNMYSGVTKFKTLDNDRYQKKKWISARDVLAKFLEK